MRTKILTALFFSALLAGCASGVKLDEVPVEDRSATSAGANVQAQPIGSAAQTSVSNVISEKSSNGIGPVGVEHVVFFDYDSFVVRADARPVIENHARFLQAFDQGMVQCGATQTAIAPHGHHALAARLGMGSKSSPQGMGNVRIQRLRNHPTDVIGLENRRCDLHAKDCR